MNYFEKLLEDKCKEEGRQDYQIQWGYDKKLYTSILLAVNESYPSYTDHGESHSNSILNNILKMFGDELKKLSSLDIWLLLEASYLHDCGMFINLKKVQEIIKEKEFKDFIKTIQYNSKDPLFKYANQFVLEDNEIKYNDSNYNPQKELAMKYLIAGYKRGSHAFELQETTTKRGEKLLPIRLYKILDLICQSHCWNFEELQRLPQKESGLINEIGHPRFISSLLRIGDLLDIDNNRMDYIQTRNLEKEIPSDSKLHLDKHLSISHFRIDSDRIEISALVDCESDTYDVADLTNLWFEYLEKEYSNQLHSWKEIVPKNFLGTLPTLGELKVEIKNYEYIDSKNKPKFSIKLEDISELLMGDSIYQNKETAIRELIQNSIDATYIRLFEEKKNIRKLEDLTKEKSQHERNELFEGKDIIISINNNLKKTTSESNYWEISIKDNGIGISKDKLKYILNTGSSFKDMKKHNLIEEMPYWLRPAGNFGIGFQSIFLLTNKITINSNSLYTKEEIEVDLFNPNKKNTVYLKKKEFNYTKEIGTEIKFSYETSRINFRYNNEEKEFLTDYIQNFDALIDTEFDAEIINLLDVINEINKNSLVNIRVLKDGHKIELSPKNLMNYKFSSENKFEIKVKMPEDTLNNLSMNNNIYFRNQLISKEKGIGLDILEFEINIIGFKAKDVLEINRNNLRIDFIKNFGQELHKAIFNYLYENYLKELAEETEIEVLLFYLLYERKFKKFNIMLDESKIKKIKEKVFDCKFNPKYCINDLISRKTLKFNIIKHERKNYELEWDETKIIFTRQEFDTVFELIFKEIFYTIKITDHSFELIQVEDSLKESFNMPYDEQIEKMRALSNIFYRNSGRVFLYFNGEFPNLKLKLRQDFNDESVEKYIRYIRYDGIDFIIRLYPFLSKNLLLCPLFLKETYAVYNDMIKEKYIDYCLKNNFNPSITREEIERELNELVKYLKEKLNLEIRTQK